MATRKVEETGIPENVEEQGFDLLTNLLEAASYKDEATTLEVRRKGKLLFTFDVKALSEKDLATARKKATSYMPNPAGKNLPPIEKELDPAKYRSWKIYLATTDEDKQRIWGNKEAMKHLNVLEKADMVDMLLTAGEKDMISDAIDKVSGFGADGIPEEEFAKN